MSLLPSRLSVAELAYSSVAAVCAATGLPADQLDPERIAITYRSDRVLRIDGTAPRIWAPLSRFWPTADGWIRTHGNYPHHAEALLRGLGLEPDADGDGIGRLLRRLDAAAAAERITAAGGLGVVVREEDTAADAAWRSAPLVETLPIGVAAPRRHPFRHPFLSGVRVLDLTRVIAGPVCTRTLALLGADVLRIDPPGIPEPEWQHLDSGHGKQSAILDARSARLHELLIDADVVVLAYRPAALARIGLSPEAIASRHPGIVVAQLSAWGFASPDRRGFDSLVQAESGIALIESSAEGTPGALPAQALLDHSAGYLLAAAVCAALRRQRDEGGSWRVRTSLRRVAAELLGLPRRADPELSTGIDTQAHTAIFHVDGRIVTTAAPALPGLDYAPPRPFGADAARW